MDASSNNITDLASLTFLTNPLYARELSKTTHEITNKDIEEKKFYKKRLNMIHKQLMNDVLVNKDIKQVHDEFIRLSITYLKMTDTKDILQQEYEDHKHIIDKPQSEFDLDTVNQQIMKHDEPKSTLDNFVTSKTVNMKQPIPPPKQKKINLKDEKLRDKGVVKRKNKNKKI
jgi:hypothetical protein